MPICFEVIDLREPLGERFRYEFAADQTITVGRRPDADMLLPDGDIAPLVARVEPRDGNYFWLPEASASNVLLNGAPTPARIPIRLHRGDKIKIGPYSVRFTEQTTAMSQASSVSVAQKLVRTLLSRLGHGSGNPYVERAGNTDPTARFEIRELRRLYYLSIRSGALAVGESDPGPGVARCILLRDDLSVRLKRIDEAGGEQVLKNGEEFALGGVTLRLVDPAEDYLADLEKRAAPPRESAAAPPAQKSARPLFEHVFLVAGLLLAIASGFGLIWMLRW